MFKNLFLNTTAIRYDANNDQGNSDPKEELRKHIAKGNLPEAEKAEKEENEQDVDDKSDNEADDGDDKEENEEKEGEEKLTEEQKAIKETEDKAAAKLQRKQDRMQRRIDTAIVEKKAAESEVARLKAVIEANPDQKLTEEEVESRAEAKTKQRLAEKELENLQNQFQKDCDTLQSGAKKVDKEFDDKIADIAEQFGPIPSFMIGALSDLDNGAKVLVFIANDDDIAEKIWGLKNKPAKMTLELVSISNKLAEAEKKPKKEISKVPDPGEIIKSGRSNSTTLTPNDAKDMEVWTRKRAAMNEEKRKARGF